MAKPITLYSFAPGPNPWIVAIILEEYDTPYETIFMSREDIHQESYELKNPNRKVPTIEDPNTGITLFESGAIIQYLIDTYDKTNKLVHTTLPQKYLTLSWLSLQMSAQGPYFWQAAYFACFHPEKSVAAAIDRYVTEMKRIVGVIDRHLKRAGTQYLVGDKCTFADLAFVMWDQIMPLLVGEWDFKTEAPDFAAWNKGLVARAVRKVLADKERATSADHAAPAS
ncbi:glutathione S-transferase [Lophium mytilinum]|uniref:Glutathione S-transferase n=1 Tax=Lophium mytilinum TaxID=390894 RepID=A0A6A6QCX5_9PEZI|nr:glutathione S-transferase [Lophium mytilinum]